MNQKVSTVETVSIEMSKVTEQSQKELDKWSEAVSIAELPGAAYPVTSEEAEQLGAFEEDAFSEEEVNAAQFDNDIDDKE